MTQTEKLIQTAMENEELEAFALNPNASDNELDEIMRKKTTDFITRLWINDSEEHH